MPTLINLRQHLVTESSTSAGGISADSESLIADTRSRVRPVQAVDRKLGLMLGRDRAFAFSASRSESRPVS
jgi:hypothetical protein